MAGKPSHSFLIAAKSEWLSQYITNDSLNLVYVNIRNGACNIKTRFSASDHTNNSGEVSRLTREIPYFCSSCPERFFTKDDLTRHEYQHTPSTKSYECQTCYKKFRCPYDLHKHHTRNKPSCVQRHECQICHREFKRASHLRQHGIVHSDARPYKCQTCDNSFKGRKDLDRHEFIHTGILPYTCGTCNKGFTV